MKHRVYMRHKIVPSLLINVGLGLSHYGMTKYIKPYYRKLGEHYLAIYTSLRPKATT